MSYIADHSEDDDDDTYVQAQLEVIAKFEENKNAERRAFDALESEDVAQAMATSEQQHWDQVYHSERELQSVAEDLRRSEISCADEELAQALQVSSDDHRFSELNTSLEQDVLRQKRKRSEDRNEGAWDCLTCTFSNRPYVGTCEMCQARAPPHILTFRSFSESLRFGVEIEVVIPDGIHDGFSCEQLAKDLTKAGPVQVVYAGYSHETTDYWKIVSDASVRASNPSRDLCLEFVSPVLKGETGLSSMRALLQAIRQIGISTNRSCGFHVHVDATKATDPAQNVHSMGTLNGIKRLSQCFVALENAFDLLVTDTVHQKRRADFNKYCRSNRILGFGAMSNRQRWDRIDRANSFTQLVHLVNPNECRYMKLNLTNIIKRDRPSTCEFRNHGGVERLLEAEAWVRLLVRFCEVASSERSSDAWLLPEDSTPQQEMEALFKLIDCNGLHQFFVQQRGLFSDVTLKNDWKCGICRRSFGNSRSYAQHVAATGHRS